MASQSTTVVPILQLPESASSLNHAPMSHNSFPIWDCSPISRTPATIAKTYMSRGPVPADAGTALADPRWSCAAPLAGSWGINRDFGYEPMHLQRKWDGSYGSFGIPYLQIPYFDCVNDQQFLSQIDAPHANKVVFKFTTCCLVLRKTNSPSQVGSPISD